MAIDSREKRQAVASITFVIGANVTTNASKDQEWRQESGYGYPGILAGGGAAAGPRGAPLGHPLIGALGGPI